MADFAVRTKFTAQDKVTKAFGRMSRSADKFGNRSEKAFRRASRSATGFSSIASKSILKIGALVGGIGTLTLGIRTVVTEFIEFDQAVTSASAKFKDLNLATEQGQKTLLELKKTARDVGAVTQFSAGEAAQGLDFLAMAGFNAKQSMVALPGVVDLATVANLDLARSTDIASDSLGAFGLMTQNTEKLQKNFTRLNDVMALTMARTNTNMEAMFEAIQKGAPAFTAAGQSLETFNALLGIMANSGVKGSEAGTSLRNVMLRLSKPVGEAQKVIDILGVKTKTSEGNFRDVVDILADMEKGLRGMGTAQRTAALSTIFGARAVTGINILLAEGSKSIRNFREEILNSAGASERMANIMRKSIGNQLKGLRSAAIELGFKFFEVFEKDSVNSIKALTEAIRTLDVKPIIADMKLILKDMKELFKTIQALPLGKIFRTVHFLTKKFSEPILTFFRLLTEALRRIGILSDELMLSLSTNEPLLTRILNFAGRNIPGRAEAVLPNRNEPLLTQNIPRESRTEVIPPNREEAAVRRDIGFQGQLNIIGAPEGSTVKSKTTGAPPIDVNLLEPSGAF